jgi:hypothetical protein
MGPFELPDVDGIDRAVDQVVRLHDFQQANPEWRIWCNRDNHVWHAERLIDGGHDNLVRYDLRSLLDELERR